MKRVYKLPENLREELKKPLGKIIDECELAEKVKNKKTAVVGDVATLALYKKNINPEIAVVDFKSERKYSEELKQKIQSVDSRTVKISNPPGTITEELWNAIARAYDENEKIRIEVQGEEDLAALACIYLAPENTVVLYGLPGKGLVAVDVTQKEKKIVKKVLDAMEA